MVVQFTPSGRQEFLEALAYIKERNPRAAQAFRQSVENGLRRLAQFPRSGRIIPEFPHLPDRELIIDRYRFFYRIDEDVVWITAVWHSRQEPDEPPK